MSATEQILNLSLKEWSMLILMGALSAVFIVFAIGAAVAMMNNPQITIKGEIDLGQFTVIITGIAMVAVTLIGQQLVSKVIVASKNGSG